MRCLQLLLCLVALSPLSVAICDEAAPWETRLNQQQIEELEELKKLIETHINDQQYGEATATAERIVTFLKENLGAEHLETRFAKWQLSNYQSIETFTPERLKVFLAARAEESLAGELGMKGKHDEALDAIRNSCRLFTQVFGEKSLPVGFMRLEVASHLVDQNEFKLAQGELQEALSIWNDVASYSHPAQADILQRLGFVCAQQRHWAASEGYFRRAFAECETVFGPEHLRTVENLVSLANVQRQQDKSAEALTTIARAAAIASDAFGDDSFTCDIFVQLGDMHMKMSKSKRYEAIGQAYFDDPPLKKAEEAYRLAHEMMVRVAPENHGALSMRSYDLAECLKAQGRPRDAEPYFRAMLQHRIEAFGENDARTARCYHHLAHCLDSQGDLAQGHQYHVKALELNKNLGVQSPFLYSALAYNRHRWGDFVAAEKNYREALALLEKQDAASPDTAYTYDNLGQVLRAQGRHAEALACFFKALPILVNRFGEDHPYTGVCYSNLNVAFSSVGRYSEAEFYARKALVVNMIHTGLDNPGSVMKALNMATVMDAQGRAQETTEFNRAALSISRRIYPNGGLPLAASLRAVARDERNRGKYQQAIELQTEAHQILCRLIGPHTRQAIATKSGLGALIEENGELDKAERLLRETLEWQVSELSENDLDVAAGMSLLGRNLAKQDRLSESFGLFDKAWQIRARVLGENHPELVNDMRNSATIDLANNKLEQAVGKLRQATRIFESARLNVSVSGLDRAEYASRRTPLPELTAGLAQLGQHKQAWSTYEQSLARALFDEVANRQALPLTDDERSTRDRQLKELHRLDEQISDTLRKKDHNRNSSSLKDLRLSRTRHQLVMNEFSRQLTQKYGIQIGQTYTLDRIQNALDDDSVLVYWLDLSAPPLNGARAIHLACIVAKWGDPAWIPLPGTGAGGSWTEEDESLPTTFRALVHNPASSVHEVGQQGRKLHQQRVAPIVDYLEKLDRGITQWIVLPSNQMAGIPIGSLLSQFHVSYAPSASVYAWNREQKRPSVSHRRLFAVGDPKLPAREGEAPPDDGVLIVAVARDSKADKAGLKRGDIIVRCDDQHLDNVDALTIALSASRRAPVESTRRPDAADRVALEVWDGRVVQTVILPSENMGIEVRDLPTSRYLATELAGSGTLRGNDGEIYRELPATRAEVEAIARLFDDDSTVLLGEEATEERVQRFATKNELRQFTHIHFATHGELRRIGAFHSALILTPDSEQHGMGTNVVFDGRLTALQILRTWKLNADLVTLSACDTGLGAYVSGEGYQGFGHAFLLSGARSVVLSLWKVDDVATYLLMTRFYNNLIDSDQTTDMTKVAALVEAKEWLRSLTSEEVTNLVARHGEVLRERGHALNSPFNIKQHSPIRIIGQVSSWLVIINDVVVRSVVLTGPINTRSRLNGVIVDGPCPCTSYHCAFG